MNILNWSLVIVCGTIAVYSGILTTDYVFWHKKAADLVIDNKHDAVNCLVLFIFMAGAVIMNLLPLFLN